MKRIAVVLVLSLLGCSSSGDDGDGGGGGDDGGDDDGGGGSNDPEPAELAGIVSAHNMVRAMVDTPTALPPVTWDPALAATAKAWVEQCKDADGNGLIDHNEDRSEGHAGYVGENVYGSSGTATVAGVVMTWAGEKSNYNYATNSCNGVCGHYTQIVWRKTLRIGCAIHACGDLRFSSTVVCNYGPGGNFNGEKPY